MKTLVIALLVSMVFAPVAPSKKKVLFQDGPLDGKHLKVLVEIDRVGVNDTVFYAPTGVMVGKFEVWEPIEVVVVPR